MSTETHPYRSAPFLDDAKPRDTSDRVFFGLAALVFLPLLGALYLKDERRERREHAYVLDAPRRSARAEQSARLWTRSAYGVDPWVRCEEHACDVVVGKAASFTLTCDTDALGHCRVGGGR